MNVLDIIFAVILGVTLLKGLVHGLVREVTSFVAVIVGFVLASNYTYLVSERLQVYFHNQQIAGGISYLLTFFAAFICVILVGLIMRRFVHAIMLGWADRLGGAVIGLSKGLLLCCLILFVLTIFLSPRSKVVAQSRISPYLNLLTQKLIVLVPETMKESFAKKSRELHQVWKNSPLYDLRHPKGTS